MAGRDLSALGLPGRPLGRPLGQASDLWWLPLRGRSRALRIGAVQVFPVIEGGIEEAQAGLRQAHELRSHPPDKHPGSPGESLGVPADGAAGAVELDAALAHLGRHSAERWAEADLTPPLLPDL